MTTQTTIHPSVCPCVRRLRFMLLSVGVFERESYDLISFFSLPTSFK